MRPITSQVKVGQGRQQGAQEGGSELAMQQGVKHARKQGFPRVNPCESEGQGVEPRSKHKCLATHSAQYTVPSMFPNILVHVPSDGGPPIVPLHLLPCPLSGKVSHVIMATPEDVVPQRYGGLMGRDSQPPLEEVASILLLKAPQGMGVEWVQGIGLPHYLVDGVRVKAWRAGAGRSSTCTWDVRACRLSAGATGSRAGGVTAGWREAGIVLASMG